MQLAALAKEGYTGGYHAFKKILRIEEDGSKIISRENTGWQHFKSDYISSAWLNPDGTRVPYCIPLDIDAKDTDKKWLDLQGKINWKKAVAFLQKNYPEVINFLLFVVRSTGGKGIHLGIAISPIVKDGKDGSTKTLFLAKQAQIALIRLLNHHGLGADRAATGIVRDLPNWRRHEPSKQSQAKQLYYNKDIHAEIKKEKRNVISEILAVTNKLKECRPPAKKDQQGILHPHKTTEARLAKLYIDLFDNLGQTKCYSMAELIELTEISKATLRNILVKRPKSRPKWLNVNYLGRTEGYEIWLDPDYGDIDRALKLAENPEYASTFLRELKLPEEVEDGERNAWLSSAAIHYKWHGYSKHQTMIALNAHSKLIPGHTDSNNCKHLVRIVESIYRNQPQLFGVKSHLELPLALNEKSEVKNIIEGPQRGREDSRNSHYSLAFTRRGNEKRLVLLEQIVTNSIVERVAVKGTGYKLQLRAIQELLAKIEKKPSKLIIKGRSMLPGNPVVQKFAKYHGFEFEFAERSLNDKRLIKEFREESLGSNIDILLRGCSTSLSDSVHVYLKNPNWCLNLIMEKQGRVLFSPKRWDFYESYVLKSCSESSLFSVNEFGKPLKNDDDLNAFKFPDLSEKKVRCDGYVGYLNNFYWLGDSWIGRKLQVVDDGTNVEFFQKAQFIKEYKRLDGKGAKTEGGTNSQWHKAKSLDSTYRRKAQKVGPSFDQLILAQIEKGQGIINTKSIFGFLRLMDSWPYEQLEAVAMYCARRRNLSYRFFNSCLEAGVE